MSFSTFRKLDYIVFYIITSVMFITQLTELALMSVIGILIGATIPTLILFVFLTGILLKSRAISLEYLYK